MADNNRSQWKSQVGFLVAAIGSAIGLGNIWRFSYMAHQYGGSAFLVPYFVALLVAGIPILLLEYGIGHKQKGAPPLSFAKISPNLEWVGWFMTIVAMFGIMLYYSVVISWCVNYLFFAFDLKWGQDTQAFFFNDFLKLGEDPLAMGGIRIPILVSTLFVWFICWVICFRDVSHGIEKACIIFMPLLLILTLVICFWTFFLKGAPQAIWQHYLKPDLSKLGNLKVWQAAFSQIFFTLSIGFGIMVTYSSYLPEKTNLSRNAVLTACINCAYSIIAGTAVFGTIGFMAASQGISFSEVIKGGPQLAFVVYPKAISLLPKFNEAFGILFFLMLVIAGISSGISLIEAFACALTDKFNLPKKNAVSFICILGFFGSIMFATKSGLLVLDIVDHFILNYGLVGGGILECVIIGWVMKVKVMQNHMNGSGSSKVPAVWNILIKYITPGILIYIFLGTLTHDLKENYGGYSTDSLFLFGVLWLLMTLIVSVAFTFYPWQPKKLEREHLPEEDELLV